MKLTIQRNQAPDLGRANLGQRVFRYYEGTQLVLYGLVGLFAGFVPFVIGTAIFGRSFFHLISVGICTILGVDHGRRRRYHRCATCRSFVTAIATKCNGCGGTIAGDIKHPDDRLEAEGVSPANVGDT